MRVLYISKALFVAAYRPKLRDLAAHVDIYGVIPERWGAERNEIAHEDYVERRPAVLHGQNHLHLYRAPGRPVDMFRPDLVHIDEEPYSAVTAQYIHTCGRRSVPCVFFAAQNLIKPLPPGFGALQRYVFRHARGAIAGTEDAARVLEARGWDGPTMVIPQFGLDTEQFRPDPLAGPAMRRHIGARDDELVVGFAGRFVPEKGLHGLLDAVAQTEGVHLILAGAGEQLGSLQERARADDLAGRVHFLGPIASTRMPGCFAAMDVLVLPSLTTNGAREQFGRVLVEAMSCAVPIIGSDCGEIPRVVDDAGLIFHEGDVAGLRDAIIALRDSPETREELGRRGRARVLAHFTGKRIAESTAEFYHQLLGAGVHT